jgi:hypothetical protein
MNSTAPTTLLNATPVTVTYRDGRTETIALGELSIRQLCLFTKHLGGNDTPALVALCAGRPVEWIDTLTDASFDALLATAIKLNFQRATNRAKTDPVALSQLAPLLLEIDRLIPQLTATLGQSGSGSSPGHAPSESATETGSASSI